MSLKLCPDRECQSANDEWREFCWKCLGSMSAPTGYRVHVLKTWPEYFEAIQAGLKTFEARKDDRDFRIGDHLKLREFNPEHEGIVEQEYTGRVAACEITYIMRGPKFGIEQGWCVMGLKSTLTPLREL